MHPEEGEAADGDRGEGDRRLLAELFTGSQAGAEAFLRAYLPMLYSLARNINLRDSAWILEDMVNEALLHLFEDDFRRLRGFRFQSKLGGYVFTVARRHLLSKAKAGLTDHPAPELWDSLAQDPATDWESSVKDQPDPMRALLETEDIRMRKQVLECLRSRLDAKDQLLFACIREGRDVQSSIAMLGLRNREHLYKEKFNLLQTLKQRLPQCLEAIR